MADGLSPNRLRAELDEHGSLEAVAKAHPELANSLRAVQRMGETLSAPAHAIEHASKSLQRALMRLPKQPKPLHVENRFETQAAALEVAIRRAREEPKGESGRPPILISREMLLGLFARGLERARSTKKRRHPTYASIADEYGLKRTWATPIVQWAERNQREARRAIVTSKIPARFSALIEEQRL